MSLEIVTASTRSDLEEEVASAFRQRWPEFIFHDPVPPQYMPRVGDYFGDFDILVLIDGRVAAGGWGVPFAWDGTIDDLPEGYDSALVRSVEDHEARRTPTAFSFMAAAVHPDHDKRGLAAQVAGLPGRAGRCRRHRPRRRADQTDLEGGTRTCRWAEYATWVREDGLSVDPWIRTHQRMGARILKVAPDSMVIPGTVDGVGAVGGHALPRQRRVRRTRCAEPPPGRPRHRHRRLPRREISGCSTADPRPCAGTLQDRRGSSATEPSEMVATRR